ncbi:MULTISPECIES: LamG-like jellyroll fold domain-containing protein [unclassified Corynebacterium]|uniref:LamG-like jellyroll fold domain-containing protein n=1 Tax=unclassified Corynebacterium TaxID=2624378 RepID=UPI0008A450EB|nr:MULTISPECIES: LamG-like jellyroll fold domain-containing protein [unclassified Corynebacterium]MDK6808341.1 metallophosphoesterase [Corynebacterium aurimucosum]NJJ84202.1 cell wall anchor domain protein [Corynebacterium aurimucosum]
MTSRRLLGTVVTASVAGTFLVVPASAAEPAEGLGSRFSIGVLPDTQFYSRYSTPETGNLAQARYGSEPFKAQVEWLVKNQEALNMDFATHLGDVVDQADVEGEWKVADEAMKVLDDSDLNYSILPGNHDMIEDKSAHPYNDYFSAERAKAANPETFQERHAAVNNDSEYHIFEAEGQKYLVLALGWRADDAALEWAQGVLDAHPDLPVILTSHEVLNIDGAGEVFYSDDYGQGLWDKFIKKNDQIFLTMGGHHHGAGYRVDKNGAGHDVIGILQDYQMAYQGGNGLLGVLEFDLSGNELEMTALSPWVAQKPAEELTQFDKLILDGKGDSYHVPLNFKERFADFAPEWSIGDENDPDLGQKARDIAEEGYTPYTIPKDQLPEGLNDFVKADETVFHWRPGQTKDKDGKQLADGDVATEGAVIPDAFGADGAGDLVREGGPSNLGERITYSTDHHPLSSDSGSLYWSDPAGKTAMAEFRSKEGADINKVDTSAGYTFESFVKIPKDFNGSEHGWGSALSRDSSIAELVDGSDDTDPTVMFGISNLRELRWWAEPKEGTGSTVWSHEVPTDEWMHIAVVNKPDSDTVEMFINGAPILRNAKGAEGLLPGDLQWVMGAGFDNRKPQDPWYGWIGETRLTQGVLDSDQWLTARPSMKDEEPSSSATTSLTESTTTPTKPTNTQEPSIDDMGQAFFAGSSRGAKVILPIIAIIAVVGGAAYGLIPTINRIFGLNIPQPKLPQIPGLN